MQVIGIEGSPRKNGNTEQLVEAVLTGAEAKGAQTRFFKLAEMQISDCIACYTCKTKGRCAIEDDMHQLYAAMQDADAIVLGSPVYFWQVNAITKRFMDRLIALINPDFSTRLNGPKKLVLAYTQGNPDREKFQTYYNQMEEMFSFLQYDVQATLVAAGTRQPKDTQAHPEVLAQADAIGKELAQKS